MEMLFDNTDLKLPCGQSLGGPLRLRPLLMFLSSHHSLSFILIFLVAPAGIRDGNSSNT